MDASCMTEILKEEKICAQSERNQRCAGAMMLWRCREVANYINWGEKWGSGQTTLLTLISDLHPLGWVDRKCLFLGLPGPVFCHSSSSRVVYPEIVWMNFLVFVGCLLFLKVVSMYDNFMITVMLWAHGVPFLKLCLSAETTKLYKQAASLDVFLKGFFPLLAPR